MFERYSLARLTIKAEVNFYFNSVSFTCYLFTKHNNTYHCNGELQRNSRIANLNYIPHESIRARFSMIRNFNRNFYAVIESAVTP